MYQANFYKKLDKERIAEEIREDGFDPLFITDPPGHLYPPHAHPEIKLLVFLEGRMEVNVKKQTFQCKPGDKLVIPGNTEHSAAVGPEGCTFFWAEKL
ncbi:MAG: cupin domain-containing protein [Candidatus Binatia bacterium]